jgi:hypothetical protein
MIYHILIGIAIGIIFSMSYAEEHYKRAMQLLIQEIEAKDAIIEALSKRT